MITARLPRRLAVFALVVTATTATFQPSGQRSAYASTVPATRARSVAMAGGPAAVNDLTGMVSPGPAQGHPMINVVTGRPMTPAQAAVADLADSQAGTVISMITARTLGSEVLAQIPADFQRVMGYAPTIAHLANGQPIAINPDGGCSVVGGGRPFDLDLPCKAHDLGYDLLRYAHRHGQDLGPEARRQIDAKFGRDLDVQCVASYAGPRAGACELMAASFDAGVGFNSWRQGFGAPTAAAGLLRTVGMTSLAAIALLLGLNALGLRMIRGVRRRRRGLGAPVHAAHLPAADGTLGSTLASQPAA